MAAWALIGWAVAARGRGKGLDERLILLLLCAEKWDDNVCMYVLIDFPYRTHRIGAPNFGQYTNYSK